MHENQYRVPLGITVQDGNYIGLTNSNSVLNIVSILNAFARDFMAVNYTKFLILNRMYLAVLLVEVEREIS